MFEVLETVKRGMDGLLGDRSIGSAAKRLQAALDTYAQNYLRMSLSPKTEAWLIELRGFPPTMPWLPVLHSREDAIGYFAGPVLLHEEVLVAEVNQLVVGFIALEGDYVDHLYIAEKLPAANTRLTAGFVSEAVRPVSGYSLRSQYDRVRLPPGNGLPGFPAKYSPSLIQRRSDHGSML